MATQHTHTQQKQPIAPSPHNTLKMILIPEVTQSTAKLSSKALWRRLWRCWHTDSHISTTDITRNSRASPRNQSAKAQTNTLTILHTIKSNSSQNCITNNFHWGWLTSSRKSGWSERPGLSRSPSPEAGCPWTGGWVDNTTNATSSTTLRTTNGCTQQEFIEITHHWNHRKVCPTYTRKQGKEQQWPPILVWS